MKQHTFPQAGDRKPLSGLSMMERTEAMLGRSHWTLEDYRRDGNEAFDRRHERGITPLHESLRPDFVRAHIELNCPPSKRWAQSKDRNDER